MSCNHQSNARRLRDQLSILPTIGNNMITDFLLKDYLFALGTMWGAGWEARIMFRRLWHSFKEALVGWTKLRVISEGREAGLSDRLEEVSFSLAWCQRSLTVWPSPLQLLPGMFLSLPPSQFICSYVLIRALWSAAVPKELCFLLFSCLHAHASSLSLFLSPYLSPSLSFSPSSFLPLLLPYFLPFFSFFLLESHYVTQADRK